MELTLLNVPQCYSITFRGGLEGFFGLVDERKVSFALDPLRLAHITDFSLSTLAFNFIDGG